MNKVTLLPHWRLPDTLPSVYDTQSGTALEMVAKVYGAMRTLQTEYNSFVDEINKTITEFVESTNQDQEQFKTEITKIIHDYIAMIDEKIKLQDTVIAENITYIKDNLSESLNQIINEMKESGELDEVILDSFNELAERIETLQNNTNQSLNNLSIEIDNLQRQVETINNKGLISEYDSSKEQLTISYKEVK